jgi:hypothetical protein
MIPQRLIIGPSIVEIRLAPRGVSTDDGGALCGVFIPTTKTIELDVDRLTGMELADTLMHEVIHAMFYFYGWGTQEKHREESVASLLGTGLALLFRDNPELLVALLRLTALGQKKLNSALDIKSGLN